MMRRIRSVLVAVAAVAATLPLVACNAGGEAPNPSPSVVPGASPGGSLRIAVSPD